MSESPATPTAAEAAATLRRHRRIDETVRARSGWYRRYLLIYAAGSVLTALVVGLAPFPGTIVGPSLWVGLCWGLEEWSRRQPVSRVGSSRRHRWFIGTWTLLWAAVVIPGSVWFRGNPAWWVPGALVMALPALVAWPWEHKA